MSEKVYELVEAARTLSYPEQIELMQAIFNLVAHDLPGHDFYQPESLSDIIAHQQASPLRDASLLVADFWPPEESADDINDYIHQQRQEDKVGA